MKKIVTRSWFSIRDRIGGTLKTELCSHDDDTYTAISFYWQDEDGDCYGVATGTDPQKIVKQSRKNLRKEWIEEQQYKKENTVPAWYGKLTMVEKSATILLKKQRNAQYKGAFLSYYFPW